VARHLYALARWCFRRRWIVLAVWLLVLIGAGVGSKTLSGPTSDTFSMPGIESIQAFDLIKERSPGAAPDGAQAKIVFQAAEGQKLSAADEKKIVDQVFSAAKTPQVASAQTPFDSGTVSADGRTGYGTISYTVPAVDLAEADKDALTAAVDQARQAGLTVAVGGDAMVEETAAGSSSEAAGVVIALFVLVITFGGLIAAGMPLLMALIGVGVGISGISIATGFLELSSTTPALASMLGLAVGIDYALFIVSRHRHELALGRDPEEAAGRALGTAGSAVVVAGLTVIIALAGLVVVNINFLTEMGLAAAATVAISVLLALTLLPALLGFAGTKVAASHIALPRTKRRSPDATTFGRRWVDGVLRHQGLVLVGGLAVAVLVAIPAASLRLALPDDGTAAKGSGPRQAYDLVAENFGAGVNGPLLIVVDTKQASDPQSAIDRATAAVTGFKDDVAAVVPATPAADGPAAVRDAYEKQLAATHLAILTVIPKSGPSEAATSDLVGDLRTAVAGVEAQTGARVLVTGQTAIAVDISSSLSSAFPRYLILIVGLAFILLILVFRSLLVPLKAVVGFLITILMALGATVAVFQWGWLGSVLGIEQGAPVMSLLPILMTGILFGLAMDYELFLVTRMREEHAHGMPARPAVAAGFEQSARVVTAAALIMLSVFGSFATASEPIIKSIGFGLATGILADAFLVRMTLVPALMGLVGERMWWIPKRLDQLLPELDVEGEKLTAMLAAEHPEDPAGRVPVAREHEDESQVVR
jgi:RND superfamily putative drug exporter